MMVTVYLVKGIDLNGAVVELGKFFQHGHALEHIAKHDTSLRRSYREVGVVIVEEREEDQHHAHRAAPGRRAAWE